MRTEDGRIIQECLNGEREAFGVLVDKYKEGIYAFVYARLRDFRDAQDVTQEVFLQAYSGLRKLRQSESFAFWLYRIAYVCCAQCLRGDSKRVDREFIEDQPSKAMNAFYLDSYRADQLSESVRDALDSLPEAYREVLMLHYFGGMNSNEMARALGTSPVAIRKRLSRARAHLKEEMISVMGTALEQQRLRTGFTFHIIEAIKRIRINPTPRPAGLPWGLSLTAGIIVALLSLGSHLDIPDFVNTQMDLTLPGETALTEVGEIPVDVLKLSRVSAISSKGGNNYGSGTVLTDHQNAVLMAPRGEGHQWPEEPTARLGKGNIGQIAYSPDGKLLAIAGSLGIWLYDARNLNEVGLLEAGHVNTVAFSHDGKILASGGRDKTVRLWDAAAQEQVGLLEGHTYSVHSVAFGPDGELLASGSSDETVRLWDVHEQRQVGVLKHTDVLLSVAFSPDGKTLASCSGWGDNTVRLWDVHEQRQVGVLRGHTDGLLSVAFSPDGRTLASGGYGDAVSLWDVQEQKQLGVLEGHNAVFCLAFSPDGKTLASGGNDMVIRLWDAQRQEKVGVLEHTTVVSSVAFSPDGRNLISRGGGTIRLWDFQEQKQVDLLEGYTPLVSSVAFSPDGKTLASGGNDRLIRLWDVQRQEQLGPLQGHELGISSVAFSPDGQTLASGCWTAAVLLWDVGGQKQVGVLEHGPYTNSVAFSPDGEILASGGWAKTVRLWDVAVQDQVGLLEGHTNSVYSVAFSPDGRLLASGSSDKTVRLWDVHEQRQVGVLEGHEDEVNSVAFSPDGGTLASGSSDGTVRLWDVGGQKQVGLLEGHTYSVHSVAFSPDGRNLASGGYGGTVCLWDVQRQEQVWILEGHTSSVASVAFSPGGRWLASGSWDGTVLLWEVNLPSPFPVEPAGKQLVAWGAVKKTELLQNFPNPFNPETWIPFTLSEPEHVTIRIYGSTGQLIRTLDLGHTLPGAYLSKEKAAYWDGRNETGETVASDVYFYAMEAGNFMATRKMLVMH